MSVEPTLLPGSTLTFLRGLLHVPASSLSPYLIFCSTDITAAETPDLTGVPSVVISADVLVAVPVPGVLVVEDGSFFRTWPLSHGTMNVLMCR